MGGPLSPGFFKLPAEGESAPFPLAVLVQGQFPDRDAGQPPPPWEEAPPGPEDAPAPATPAEEEGAPGPAVILVGAATLFQKQMFQGGGHVNFFLNAMDALTLGDELVTIRSKRPVDRSIARTSGPEKIMWRLCVTLLLPAMLAAGGMLRLVWRGGAKRGHRRMLAAAARETRQEPAAAGRSGA
jgi:ABC-type uncharacterized transport system involved in gliding motility auxiliary subunit